MAYPDLPDHFQPAFHNRWEHRIQREQSLLGNTVTMDSVEGYRKKYDQLEKQSMRLITTRHGNTTQDEFDAYIRWLVTKKYELTNVLDEWDDKELGSLITPQGRLTENHVFGYNRTKDSTIVSAVEGNAYTGEDGATLTAVPASQIVAATYTKAGTSVNSGLTFEKVAQAKRIFRGNALMTGRDVCAVIGPDDEEDLIADVNEIRNSDFSRVAPIDAGGVHQSYWMGFSWIVGDDDLLTTASSITNCLFYHKKYVMFGDGERRANIDILPDQSHAVQIRSRCRLGATRLEEKAVVLVKTYHA
jgi:hypothetical protein